MLAPCPLVSDPARTALDRLADLTDRRKSTSPALQVVIDSVMLFTESAFAVGEGRGQVLRYPE
jgi:hypothetical protein